MDTAYLPFYNQGYRILSILLPGIWDTVLNISVCRTGSAVAECLTRDRGPRVRASPVSLHCGP